MSEQRKAIQRPSPRARPCTCFGAPINYEAGLDCHECGRCGKRWLRHFDMELDDAD